MNNKVITMPKHTVLIVDDEAAIRGMLCIALEAADFNVLDSILSFEETCFDNQKIT